MNTGIPTGKSSGKVEPHIEYASYMGLVVDSFKEGKHTLHLTDLGSLVVREDPGISENVTRMLCHLRMTSPFGGAPLWTTVISELLAQKPLGLSTNVLMDALKKESSVNINIHSFPADVRNRFDATLFANNSASWRVVNSDYQIIPPLNKAALAAYNSVVNLLPEGEGIQLSKVIDILAAPPYGMNDYEAVYMIASVFANLSYCLRVEYKKQSYTISKWKDVVIGDSKIELAAIRETIVRRINAGAVADQFLALFNRINANTDTAMVEQLSKELDAIYV